MFEGFLLESLFDLFYEALTLEKVLGSEVLDLIEEETWDFDVFGLEDLSDF